MRGRLKTVKHLLRLSCRVYENQGFRVLLKRIGAYASKNAKDFDLSSYGVWCKRIDAALLSDTCLSKISGWSERPFFSIILPTYNTPVNWLDQAIGSVRSQTYPNWELCIADDASTSLDTVARLRHFMSIDRRIKVEFRQVNGHISQASNTAIGMASGDYLVLLDHDDILHPQALELVALKVFSNPAAAIIFSDEDKIDEQGVRTSPYFKSEFNYELFLSHNMISHLGVYKRSLVKSVGGFRDEFVGSQDYDLALRCIEQTAVENIAHIPNVLYHWRIHDSGTAKSGDAKPYAKNAAIRAVGEHFARCCVAAMVENNPEANGMHRLQFALPDTPPKVEIIFINWEKAIADTKAISEILKNTTYSNYDYQLLDLSSEIKESNVSAAIEVRQSHSVCSNFFHALNVMALSADSTYVCFFDLALRPLTERWLEELVSQAIRPGIGCVGARLWNSNDCLAHAGIVIGMNGSAGFAHQDLPRHHSGYLGRAVLLQEFSALSMGCMVVQNDEFKALGGFDTEYAGALAGVDFCLRIKQRSLRNIWTPNAELRYIAASPTAPGFIQTDWDSVDIVRFKKRWVGCLNSDPAYSRNFVNQAPGFSHC